MERNVFIDALLIMTVFLLMAGMWMTYHINSDEFIQQAVASIQ